MFRFLVVFLLCVAGITEGQVFTSQVYQLAETYSEKICATDPECDCCSSDLIFLSLTQFAMINRCIPTDEYYMGTYSVKSGKLILSFKPVLINEITDEETNKVENKKELRSIKQLEFTIETCGSKRVKLRSLVKEPTYGSRLEKNREVEIIKELKQKDAWKILSSAQNP